MPVQADFVPLDTAKTWAKRLARTSKTLTPNAPLKLSQCQLAVAQMLGYEHWHAMQQALTMKGLAISTAGAPPQHPIVDAREFWVNHLGGMNAGHESGGDVTLEKRGNTVNMRQRIHGRSRSLGECSISEAIELLKALFEGAPGSTSLANLQQSLLDGAGNGNTYISGHTELPYAPHLKVRYQALPVYPNGLDLVVRGLSTEKRWTLKNVHLLPQAQRALLEAANITDGVFLVNGSTGVGKTALTIAVLDDLSSAKDIKQGERRKKVVSVEDPPEYVHEGTMLRVDRHTHANSGEAYTKGIQAALRSGPDYLMVGEIRDKQTAKAVFRAASSAVVFTSFNSTAGGVLERLEDFELSGTKLNLVRGWACPRLLPVLCQECCQPDGQRGGMKQGPGCGFCKHLGIQGRQMVLDVWECGTVAGNPMPRQTASQLEQARQLVRDGVVSLEDAIDQLGPLNR